MGGSTSSVWKDRKKEMKKYRKEQRKEERRKEGIVGARKGRRKVASPPHGSLLSYMDEFKKQLTIT